jgi:L-amino acid N-acyltransferase YncA
MLEEEYQPRRKLPPHLLPVQPPETPFEFVIRDAMLADLPHVREIYNHYVRNSSITFDEKPISMPAMKAKFQRLSAKKLPFLVAVSPTGQILGYALVVPWIDRAAARYTVESSIYLGPAATGKGLGKPLLGALIERSKAAGLREMVAIIADKGAEASIAIHQGFGFKDVGHMGKVGFKFNRWLGTVMMEKKLK